jgi:DNA polymerase III epsilon subunit-like protein
MPPWKYKFIFFDVETTGLMCDPHLLSPFFIDNHPRVVQLAWAVTDDKCNVMKQKQYTIKPDKFVIPVASSAIHGITTEIALRSTTLLPEALAEFITDVRQADVIVCYNSDFDITVIMAEFFRTGIYTNLKRHPILCVMKLSSEVLNGGTYMKLTDLYQELIGYQLTMAHQAGEDVRATVVCLRVLMKKYAYHHVVKKVMNRCGLQLIEDNVPFIKTI